MKFAFSAACDLQAHALLATRQGRKQIELEAQREKLAMVTDSHLLWLAAGSTRTVRAMRRTRASETKRSLPCLQAEILKHRISLRLKAISEAAGTGLRQKASNRLS